MKISKKWFKRAEIYKFFAENISSNLSFTTEDALKLYIYESTGKGNISIDTFNGIGIKINGYAVGKKWTDWQVNEWRIDMSMFINGQYNSHFRGRYTVLSEIYNDSELINFHWWLDEIFKDCKYLIECIKSNKNVDMNGQEYLDELNNFNYFKRT